MGNKVQITVYYNTNTIIYMGLSIRQVQDGEPASNRSKRMRLSKDKFRFRYFTSDEVSALHRGGEHLNTEEESPEHEGQEGQQASTIAAVDDVNSVLSMNSSMSSSSVPARVPTLLETLDNLRERLSRVRERRRTLTHGAGAHRGAATRGTTPAMSPLTTRTPTGRSAVAGRSIGRLTRVPSVHSRRGSRLSQLPRVFSLTGSGSRLTEAQRQMASESIISRPMRHLNTSFVVNGHGWANRGENSHFDNSDEFWENFDASGPESIERRRQIVQELGVSLRETRRRAFENTGLEMYDYSTLLWNMDDSPPAGERDADNTLERACRVTREGCERFAIPRDTLEVLSRASIERFGRVLPSGVLFEEMESESGSEH